VPDEPSALSEKIKIIKGCKAHVRGSFGVVKAWRGPPLRHTQNLLPTFRACAGGIAGEVVAAGDAKAGGGALQAKPIAARVQKEPARGEECNGTAASPRQSRLIISEQVSGFLTRQIIFSVCFQTIFQAGGTGLAGT